FFQGVDFATAVGENPVFGLCIGVCVALVVTAAMFLPRKLMTLSGYMDGVAEGVRSMVGAIMILVLAWSLGGTCRYLLGTGEFVSGFLNSIGVGLALLPVVIFVVAAFIGHMGTSGTIALIPLHRDRRVPGARSAVPGPSASRWAVGAATMCAYFDTTICRRRARKPPAPRGHAAAVRFGGGGRVSGGLHHRRLHGQPADRARRRRRADDRGCAGAEPLEVRGGEGARTRASELRRQRAPDGHPPRALCARSRPRCARPAFRSPPAVPASVFSARLAPRRRPARQMYRCFTWNICTVQRLPVQTPSSFRAIKVTSFVRWCAPSSVV
ncbi:MAG: Na+/H+ antiporter NhaC family protein, partial [Eggerthellaceae bacterium]